MPGPFDFQPLIGQIDDILRNRPAPGTGVNDPNWLASLSDRFQGMNFPRFGTDRQIPGLQRRLNPVAGDVGTQVNQRPERPPLPERPPRPSYPDQLASGMLAQDQGPGLLGPPTPREYRPRKTNTGEILPPEDQGY